MSSEFLTSYVNNAGYALERLISQQVKTVSFEVAKDISFYYRQKGCCSFLHSGQTSIYFDSLHRSASSYLYYLQNANESEKQTSEIAPLFDAINAGFWQCMELMAENSRADCNFNCEYEDDFLYSHFLLTFFFRKKERISNSEKILSRYQIVLEGADDVRFRVCKSFLENSSDDFNENFVQMLIENAEEIERKIKRESIGEDVWSWSRYISGEALALLKLAYFLEFDLDINYRQVPEALRYHPEVAFNPASWVEKISS